MAYIIPLLVIIFSAGGLSYILIRRIKFLSEMDISRIENKVYIERADFEDRGDIFGNNILGKVFSRIKRDDTVFVFMEKFFRKMRVRMMKVENFLTDIAERLHKRNIERKMDKSDKSADDLKKNSEESGKISVSSMGESNPVFDEQYWLDVLKQNPKSAYPYKKLSAIYLDNEDFSSARSMLRYALKIEPDDKEIKQKIESLRGKRNRKMK